MSDADYYDEEGWQDVIDNAVGYSIEELTEIYGDVDSIPNEVLDAIDNTADELRG